ncbi:MAG: DUF805 domain-containing protein [Muribaculum sp.]|nr:DUF805 domain-containing protein [Muribaculum sp.]
MYQYQVSFGDAIHRAFNKYCCFTGRASHSEFWWWILFTLLVSWVVNIIVSLVARPETVVTVSSIIGLIFLLPSLGLWFRRLHDIGKSGWWWLLSFIPLIGIIILIVWWCQDSQPSENQYGPIPNLTERNNGVKMPY